MSSRSAKGAMKLPYEKPAIKTIELAAEEVLGIGCKTGVAPAGVPDMQICVLTACDQEGS